MVATPKDARELKKVNQKARHAQLKKARGFYARVLEEAERILLKEARQVQGLDEEIALLRVLLAQVVQDHPEDLALMLRGMDLLVKAVSARYRLSAESKEDLAASIEQVIRQLGGAFMPEVFHDG